MSDTPVPILAIDGDALLAEADALHDDEPQRALALLRGLDLATLSPGRLPRLSFLLDHVLGEKFALWSEALAGQRALVQQAGVNATPPIFRQDAEPAGRGTLQALQPLAALHATPGGGLDTAFGVVSNKLASEVLERPLAEFAQLDLRTALQLAAQHSQRFWQRSDTWLNRERAHYLGAMAAHALGDAAEGIASARTGLALLDQHDQAGAEDVDRAFFELELATGLRLAGRPGRSEALTRALVLAARFGDAFLDRWFADRLARNEALAAHYGARACSH